MIQLSTSEAAARLGISRQTMHEHCVRGNVPGAKMVGRTWIIPEKSLEKVPRTPGPKRKKTPAT